MSNEVTIEMPLNLTKEMIDAVANDPLCIVEDLDEYHKRLGWLYCAYDAMVKARVEGNKQ